VLDVEVTMRMPVLATASILVFGMGAVLTHAADTSKTAPKPRHDMPAMSGTSQPTKPGAKPSNMPSTLPPSPNRPTGSMADPPLASPPSDLGAGHAPDK
jgi:hypothetical protein